MSKKIKIQYRIKEGKKLMSDLDRQKLKTFSEKTGGKVITCTLDASENPTNPQRGYYFAFICAPIAHLLSEYQGETVSVEDVHWLMKRKLGFVKTIVDPETGEVSERVRSVANVKDIEKQEMGQLIEGAIEWAARVLELEIKPPKAES